MLLATALLLAFALRNPGHFFSISFYALLLAIQVVLLIKYVNKVHGELNQFYRSVINEDATISLPGHLHKEEPLLSDTLNAINARISQLRYDKQVNYSYLREVVNHLNTGIIAYKENGAVDLVNRATLDFLGLPDLKHIGDLKVFGKDFYSRITNPSITGRETIELKRDQGLQRFSLRSSMFRLGNHNVQLLSFHNINEELEVNELKSWEKLIRVITHEIMNSVSPIVSLTTTLGKIFRKREEAVKVDQLEDKHIKDTLRGLDIIRRRGSGLMAFVKKIRQVHLLPDPIQEEILVGDLFEGVIRLMKHSLEEHRVQYEMSIRPDGLSIYADRNLIEQVLINMVKNSIEAFPESTHRKLNIKAYAGGGYVMIQVIDNGRGIDPELFDQIFIPFFSTKEGGSGIGLSLARQIMRFHQGNIDVHSRPYEETVFSLKFLEVEK
jgi:signal transduction histidine kinase